MLIQGATPIDFDAVHRHRGANIAPCPAPLNRMPPMRLTLPRRGQHQVLYQVPLERTTARARFLELAKPDSSYKRCDYWTRASARLGAGDGLGDGPATRGRPRRRVSLPHAAPKASTGRCERGRLTRRATAPNYGGCSWGKPLSGDKTARHAAGVGYQRPRACVSASSQARLVSLRSPHVRGF
jgi:hypothetical protein